MHKEMNVRKIESKFQQLMQLEQGFKPTTQREQRGELLSSIFSMSSSNKTDHKPKKVQSNTQGVKKATNDHDELIFTKSDICKEVAKLKPYLRHFGDTKTSVQLEDRANKHITDQEQNSLSQMVIYLNKELCEKLRANSEDQKYGMRRQNREKEGWVYQVFYRLQEGQPIDLSQTVFKNGYVVLTEILELFSNLTFQKSLLKVNINELKRVKYFEQREYQVMDIRFKEGTLQVAFLIEAKMKLFDRMLFLLKNMARTSSTRLFQNQLLKNIYSQY